VHTTGCTTTVCLLLGRTLGIGDDIYGDLARICDGWKRRPKTWNIYTQGTETNPFWKDPYISRKTQLKLRGEKIEKKGGNQWKR